MFDGENKNLGAELSLRVGGAGSDACDELKKPLVDIFKEWRADWKKRGLLPKRIKKA